MDLDHQLSIGKYTLEAKAHHDNLFNSKRKDNPFVQSYINSRIWQYWELKPSFSAASWIEYDHFINSNSYRLSTYLGVRYQWDDILELKPLIGYSWDYRSMRLDQGFSPALWLRSRYRWEDGLQMETNAFARLKFIDPRHQRNLVINSLWAKSFDENADLAVGLKAGSNEIDDYRSNSVQRIRSDTLSPKLSLRYQFQPGLYWDSDNQLTYTNREFNYEVLEGSSEEFNNQSFNQMELFSRQKLSFGNKKLSTFFLFEYQTLDRRYDLENNRLIPDFEFQRQLERERQKDFYRSRVRLEAQFAFDLNPKHRLKFQANNRYLQYDTPAESNFDDHDELSYGLSAHLESRWNRSFSTQYRLIGQRRQYAFLFEERSRDNYTQYSLRMEFDYRWDALKNLSLNGYQYVYVNYNIKDFEDVNLTDRSNRNLESQLYINYRPSKRWNTQSSFYRREAHVSYINWLQFAETTLDTNITYILEHKHIFDLTPKAKNSRIFFELGYKHFSLGRRFNTSMTNANSQLVPINLRVRNLQSGPLTNIRYFRRSPATIDLSIWWQFQYQDNKFSEIEQFTTLSSSFKEENLRKINRFFRPFFKLGLNFWLYDPSKK